MAAWALGKDCWWRGIDGIGTRHLLGDKARASLPRDRQDQGGERSQRESKVRERIMERPQRAEPSKSRREGTEKVTATGQREISAAHWNF